jgi:hypothetical protein
MTLHVFNTWLVANLLHPVLFLVLILVESPGGDFRISPEILSIYIVLVFFSCFISFPGLCLARILFGVIIDKIKDDALVFITWFTTVVVVAFLNFVVFCLLFERSIEFVYLGIPAAASAFVAAGIRYYQLRKLIQKQRSLYELDLA